MLTFYTIDDLHWGRSLGRHFNSLLVSHTCIIKMSQFTLQRFKI